MEPVANDRLTLPSTGKGADLRNAIRRARLEEAERSAAISDLREAEISRLQALHALILPLFEHCPPDAAELFDPGMTHGNTPRLFIDMVSFVEMGRDKRLYRFIQDSRDGRVVLAETVQVERMVEAITAYVARRLVAREKSLTSDPKEAAHRSFKPGTRGLLGHSPSLDGLANPMTGLVVAFIIGMMSGAALLYVLIRL